MIRPCRVSPMKHYGAEGFLIQTPYDEIFVEQIREMVPIKDRWFNRSRRGWWVAEEHREIVLHLVHEAFGGAIIVVGDDGREITHEGDERLEQGRLL